MSTVRSTCWSLTINNPCDADEENIAIARQKGWTVEGQKEKGENGTVHYQLMLKTPQKRFSTIKKAFPRAHIEVARNPIALEQYVNKEDTRVGQLDKQSLMYPSLSKLWDLIFEYCLNYELIEVTYPHNWRVRMKDRRVLDIFDDAIRHYIMEGYHVETMGVNPQVRSAFDKYHKALFHRSSVDRQTDRQTDTQSVQSAEDNISVDDITNGLPEEEILEETRSSSDVPQTQNGDVPSSP